MITTHATTLQVARDHLIMCQCRLDIARRAVERHGGTDRGFAIIERYQREAEVGRALDFVWQAQGCQNAAPTGNHFVDDNPYLEKDYAE